MLPARGGKTIGRRGANQQIKGTASPFVRSADRSRDQDHELLFAQ